MEDPLQFNKLKYVPLKDGQLALQFLDKNEDWFAVKLPLDQLRPLIADMIKFTVSLQVDAVLSPDSDAQADAPKTIPATESALLIAKDARLVRWPAGGAVLLATTTEGMSIQLAMGPAVVDAVRLALANPLPES